MNAMLHPEMNMKTNSKQSQFIHILTENIRSGGAGADRFVFTFTYSHYYSSQWSIHSPNPLRDSAWQS